MESDILDAKLQGLKEQLAGCDNWPARVFVLNISKCGVNSDENTRDKQPFIELYKERIEQLEWAKEATREDIITRRGSRFSDVPSPLMAYYAGMLPQDKLSMKEIRLLALLEDLDIALGTHPAIRRA